MKEMEGKLISVQIFLKVIQHKITILLQSQLPIKIKSSISEKDNIAGVD